ncbi:hypothetical protein [Streptomyces sp. XY332]|uniref:hypothetical protein n=1 Tax=Streptomyces sp. XY332 TaxID=1415561 RepID=UPI00061ECC2B|nr:hypothetical protein [Streptomyces sp. XY332]KJY44757.1 hypothetical protein VR46_18695 [Streptomyces sp. NRRL S-444]
MAGPVYFRKVSEDPETVRCAFGPDPEGMPRTLTMHKAPRTSAVDDDRPDHLALKASESGGVRATGTPATRPGNPAGVP